MLCTVLAVRDLVHGPRARRGSQSAQRAFEQRFELADFVVVKDASYENGLLAIDLERETPEALKPRCIAINAAKPGGLSRLVDRGRRTDKAA